MTDEEIEKLSQSILNSIWKYRTTNVETWERTLICAFMVYDDILRERRRRETE